MQSSSVANSTRRGRHKKLKAMEGEEEDIISSKLPESLISEILSLIPLKDAVRTSVLSKRWIHRWMSITRFQLSDDDVYVFYSPMEYDQAYRKRKKLLFTNFVNRVLALTNGSTLERFSLVTYKKYEESLLNTWISDILIRRVKNLRICIDNKLSFSPLASHSLFSSHNYLEELVLDLRYCSIKVPPCGFVYFSSLKLLELCGTTFTFDSSLDLNLPNLKKFKTENCFWLSACAGSVTVDAPLLETIFIEYNSEDADHLSSCAINFTASQLKKITYVGAGYGVSQLIILPAPSSACDAFANIILLQYDLNVPETESRAFMLLKQFCQVKSLKFDGIGLEVLTQPNVLPVFPMLCHLELGFLNCEVLLGLLQKSPLLKTLILNKGVPKFDKELLNSCVVPECLTSTLQVVKFKKVNGKEHELCLAKLFLENGAVLERMSFSHIYRRRISKVMENFKEKLLSFKKGFSCSAIIEFPY